MELNRVTTRDRRRPSKSTLEVVIINLISYLIFLAFASLILWAQIEHHAFIAGTDSAFHMNRFYETAMQIKTGHFSYFQSLFGFHQTGRIVTAFYGPLMAYLCGGLLLICKNWINFQIVNSLLVLSLSGWFMYILCVKSHVERWASLILGTLYMTCYPVSIWPTAQKFTGLGAALLPLAILCGVRMLNDHRIRILPLALVMTLIMQTHIVSSVVAAMALLPMFVAGLVHSKRRDLMVVNGFKAAGLTILLSGNVWGTIVNMFTTNHIIPVFPQQDMYSGTIHFYHFHLTYLGWIMTIVALIDVVVLIYRWRYYDYRGKTVMFTGLFFLWLSSPWFPWGWVHQHWTWITNVIQFPRRFLIVAIILFLLSFGQICSNRLDPNTKYTTAKEFKLRNVKYIFLLVLMICSVGGLKSTIDQEVSRYRSAPVLNEPLNLVHVAKKSPQALRSDFGSSNLGLAIRDVSKSTPDYLPSSNPLTTNQDYYRMHPYHFENVQLDADHPYFHRQLIDRDQLRINWRNPGRQTRRTVLPLAVYHQTQVTKNGRSVADPKITSVGALVTRARPGVNHVTIKYHPDFSLGLMILITIFTWADLIVYEWFYRR